MNISRLPVALSCAATLVLSSVAAFAEQTTGQLDIPAPSTSQPFFHPTDKAFVSRFLRDGQWMPTTELKPGMMGYGLTVFRGNKIEKFNVQIISVVKKMLNGRDAILARLSGGEMGKNCVIKGMSGSPCYINGKLIGAVSFGFDFEKEPIAGITPIVDMLDALAESTPGTKPSIAHLSAPSWAVRTKDANGYSTVSSGAPRMIPLMSPVSLVGFSPRAEEFLAGKFKDIGLGVSSGAAGALDPQLAMVTERDIKPGSAVSVLLAEGDFNIAATGTATAKFGDKVVAFGHPFMQGGSIDFPMATAYVHQVMPSLSASFKLASPVSVVGSITADRPWAIGGLMGRHSKMIPVSYTVVDETRRIQRTYNCEVIDHPEMTPDIIAATATSAIDATHQASGPYVAKVESHIEADGITPIDRVDRFATGLAPKTFFDMLMGGDPVGRYVQRATDQICNNDFQKASIKNVKLKITIQDGHETARIDRVYIDKPFVAPGEDVKVTAIIKPFNHEPVEETMTLRVPRDIPDGNMVIGVAGGQDYDSIKTRLGIVDPEPENVQQIADRIRGLGRGDQIALIVALPEQSLVVSGTKLTNPPAYWTKLFVSNRHTKGPNLARGEMKQTKTEDWMLYGSHIIAVEVRSHDKAAAKAAPVPISVPYNNDDLSITDQARKAMESMPAYPRKGQIGGGHITIGGNAGGGTITLGGMPSPSQPSNNTNNQANAGSSSKSSSQQTLTAATGKDYPHVRPLQIWRQDSDEEFRGGKFDDSTVDSWGRISPGFDSIANKQVSTEDQIWSSLTSGGYFYYGSGNEVWRWKGDQSRPEKVAKLDGLFIPAMAADSKGTIYAAPVPSGKVYAINTQALGAKPKAAFTLNGDQIVASLAVDDNDNLYIGTAGTGKVYKANPARNSLSLLFDTQQAHVLSMFYSRPDATLYIGTGEKGSVYTVDSTGKIKAIYQSPDHFVTGIVKDKRGDLYVASAGQGHLVRITPSGEQMTLASSDAFYRLHYDPQTDSVFSGDAEGDITMACLDPLTKQPYFMPVCHTEQEAVMAISSDGKNLFAGSSNLAVLRAFRMQLSTKPVYTSSVKDGGRSSQWSRLHAMGPFNDVSKNLIGKLRVETRTGNTAKPDETWSTWEAASPKEDSFAISSPSGRYFQYRVTWNTTGDTFSADKIDRLTLGRIDTTFLPENSAPQISNISLKAGTAVAGKQELTMTGTDSDGDNLIAAIEISGDGGTTWKALKDEIRSKSAKKDSKSDDEDKDEDKKDDSDKATETKDKDTPDNPIKDEKVSTSTSDGDDNKDSKDKEDKDKDSHSESEEKNGGTPEKSKTSLDGWTRINLEEGAESKPAATEKKAEGDKKSGDETKDKDKDSKDKDKKAADGDKKKDTKTASSKSTKKKKSGSSSSDKSASTEGGGPTTENFTYNWDTTKQKDGNYLIRFVVDDKLSNPAQHQDVVNLRSVTVDNTAPEIQLIDYKKQPNGRIEFKVTAKDKLTPIANATYKIDEGEPFAFSFTPDSIDGLNATLVAAEVPLTRGQHKVEVKVSDRAGNTTTKTITVR